METKTFCVYRHTSPSGKVYIGITCQRPEKRWQNGRGYLYSHNPHFYNAIQKYGWLSFTHEIICTNLSQGEAERLEVQLIAEHKAADPRHGYNQAYGGCHQGRATPETRRKLSEAKTGEKNPNYGKHVFTGTPYKGVGENHHMYGRRGADNPRFGMKHTEKALEKMRKNAANARAVLCVETGTVYPSAEEAGRATGISGNGIAGCCRRKPHYNTAGGYQWKYADEPQ